jgi:hypothetical protein
MLFTQRYHEVASLALNSRAYLYSEWGATVETVTWDSSVEPIVSAAPPFAGEVLPVSLA